MSARLWFGAPANTAETLGQGVLCKGGCVFVCLLVRLLVCLPLSNSQTCQMYRVKQNFRCKTEFFRCCSGNPQLLCISTDLKEREKKNKPFRHLAPRVKLPLSL